MTFQIHALDPEPVRHLFDLGDAALAEARACRMTVTAKPGFPCRISLEDAEIGEQVILLNHEHLPGTSPYRSRHAIFIRQGIEMARPQPGEVPASLSLRLISLRGFDADDMMRNADVAQGAAIADAITSMFEDAAIAHIDLHNAKPGCFAARVTRS